MRLEDEEMELGNLLPREINGWRAEEDLIFDPDTIFKYLDGSGEVYRAFNFRKLLARHFIKEGRPKIIADLFDMGTDRDAYGIFSHGYEGDDAGMGQGSGYTGGLFSFWKGHLFVSLFAEKETSEAKEALFALAKTIASAIQNEGQIPEIVSLFPPEGLEKSGVCYFHSHLILNSHFFLADANILHLDQQTEAALGVYAEQGEKYYLLLVRYPDEKAAEKALESFLAAYMPDASEPGIVQTEDRKWTAAKREGTFLTIVFNALSNARANKNLASIPLG